MVVRFRIRGASGAAMTLKAVATTDHGDDVYFKASLAVRSEVECDPDDPEWSMKYDCVVDCAAPNRVLLLRDELCCLRVSHTSRPMAFDYLSI